MPSRIAAIIVPRTHRAFYISTAASAIAFVLSLFLSILFIAFSALASGLLTGILSLAWRKQTSTRPGIVSAMDSLLTPPIYTAFLFALLDLSFYVFSTPLAFIIMEVSSVFVMLSVLSVRYSTRLYGDSSYVAANYLRKSSGYLFLLAIAVFLFLDFYTAFLAAPLLMYALSVLLGETGGIISETNALNLKSFGIYLKENQRRMGNFFILLGIVIDILLIPKPGIYNDYILGFFLFLGAVFAIRSAYSSYKISILLMELAREEPFGKHVYYPKSVRDESIDFLIGDAREFLVEGNNNGLVMSLAYILTKYGYEFQKIKQILDGISAYKKPEIVYSRGDITRDIARKEMERRRILLDSAMRSIAGE
ncbi:MAG: hypothetical protein M1138_06800 [Candidatus Thermoplasmatota archaeon]|nr:hypothetical protein [Candidatus Thermoplasmatota archaeon]